MVFLLTLVALTWNFVAVLIGTFLSKDVSVASVFFATLIMVIGIPGAWYTWCVQRMHELPVQCTCINLQPTLSLLQLARIAQS